MPPRVSVASLRSLKLQNASRSFCCSQCLAHRSIARANLRSRITALKDIRTGRFVSTAPATGSTGNYNTSSPLVTPATAINKPLDVAPANSELYKALERLKTDAANYVGVSRLGLALRSLEGKEGVVRVAVLAMDGDVDRVKKLVRLMLADPLGKEEDWERELVDGGNSDSVLLRYGDEGDAFQSSSQVRTLAVPSRTLHKHNLELLVSSLQLETAPSEFGPASRAHDAILVPGFDAQATSSGRYSHMTYPVHKTLLVGDGLKSLVDYGKFTAGTSIQDVSAEMVQLAIQAPSLSGSSAAESTTSDAVVLDVEAGEHALASIRQSINNALAWEHGWFKAGIPPLSAWLLAGTTTSNGDIKPIVKQLLNSVLNDTESSIASAAVSAELAAKSATVPDSVRRNILKATASWSEEAHDELRNQLDLAFASKNWAKLKWYKLFWRSDDVTMLLSEIMERRWLIEAEKGAIYLAGRIEGSGLVSPGVEGKLLNRPSTLPRDASEAAAPSPAAAADVSVLGEQHPYHMHIPITRESLSSRTIPSLQALSQKLVLQTGSATAVTSALTAMAYIGFSNASLFEAGAVFAFGVVISLKRLQNKWEAAREYWQGEVREEGRLALKQTEDGIKEIVEVGGVRNLDVVGIEDRQRAKAAVDIAKEALSTLK